MVPVYLSDSSSRFEHGTPCHTGISASLSKALSRHALFNKLALLADSSWSCTLSCVAADDRELTGSSKRLVEPWRDFLPFSSTPCTASSIRELAGVLATGVAASIVGRSDVDEMETLAETCVACRSAASRFATCFSNLCVYDNVGELGIIRILGVLRGSMVFLTACKHSHPHASDIEHTEAALLRISPATITLALSRSRRARTYLSLPTRLTGESTLLRVPSSGALVSRRRSSWTSNSRGQHCYCSAIDRALLLR